MEWWSRSSTSTSASGVPAGWLRKYAPTSLPYQVHVYSVSAAAWMPVKPPPARM